MNLRLRLVAALVVLVTAGLAVFGLVTYGLYSRSQYDQLDDQIRASVPLLSSELRERAGLDGQPEDGPGGGDGDGDHGGEGGGRGGGPPGAPLRLVPPGTYAELHGDDGAVATISTGVSGTDVPAIPEDVASRPRDRVFDVGSVDGSTDWRVLVTDDPGPDDLVLVAAVPGTDVDAALERLVLIEGAAAAALLALLGVGAWLILRQGLSPLERMAATARTITAGELDTRVAPADDRSEVGQLGLALNTMLSELEDAFAEREASEARLRQFLADVSHELRTPLTSIQGFAELFRLGAQQDHVDLQVIMRRIEDESERMKTLVNDLLLLAHLDRTRPVERQAVDLAVLAADACSDAVAADPTRPVVLDAPEPVVVTGDRDHLRQAIGNLVANAVRHTPGGTTIEVGAGIEGGQAVVTVRDHGPGLDDEALARAFDRFWRASDSRAGAGAGLGLSIVAGIAGEHGGTATVANAAGGGALFRLELPITAPEPRLAAVDPA